MIVDRKAFTDAVTIASYATAARPSLPGLACVLLQPIATEVEIHGTDLEMRICQKIAARPQEGDEPVLIHAKSLLKILKALPKACTEITVSIERIYQPEPVKVGAPEAKTETVEVVEKKWDPKVLINGIIVTSYQATEFPEPPTATGATVTCTNLLHSIERVAAAMSTDESRFSLNGVCLDFTNGQVVATDGHRLFTAEINRDPRKRKLELPASKLPIPSETNKKEKAKSPDIIIPNYMVLALLKPAVKKLVGPDLVLSTEPVHRIRINLTSGGWIDARLIEGQFPNYQQVVPAMTTDDVTEFSIPLTALEEALKMAMVIAEERNTPGVLVAHDGGVNIMAMNNDGGFLDQTIAGATFTGRRNMVGLNMRYLVDAMTSTKLDIIKIKMREEIHPIRMDAPGFVAITMPIRMDNVERGSAKAVRAELKERQAVAEIERKRREVETADHNARAAAEKRAAQPAREAVAS